MPGGDHYFSPVPGSPAAPRPLTVNLAGRVRRLTTASGIFSPDHVDTGSQVLLDCVPPPPSRGRLLDIGCGWGALALTMALLAPEAEVWAVDVNERALELVRRNARSLGLENVRAATPEGVPDGVAFDAIWSNPPIRVGKPALHGILARWLPRLAAGCDAWLVVQRNLGSDSLQRWLQETLPDGLEVGRHTSSKGFRVLRVHRSGLPPRDRER